LQPDNITPSMTTAGGSTATMLADSSLLTWRRNVDDCDTVGELSVFSIDW